MAIKLPYYIAEGDTTSNTKIETNFEKIAELLEDDTLIYKITKVGTTNYVGFALPGSAESSAVWQCEKVLADATITWADGNQNFDNISSDLTALTYS